MKLSDYIVDYIASLGTKDVFIITGGAIAHVTDSLGRRAAEQKDISYVCFEHEQAGAMAAEAYSRLGPGIGVMCATSGPGATNLITGMCGCWFDSIPALFITGQVGSAESLEKVSTKPRQIGFQETDIVSIVRPITKFAVKVDEPRNIRYCLEKAVYIATSGRPGPALVDIPVDFQVVDIDPDTLPRFSPKELKKEEASDTDTDMVIEQKIEEIIPLVREANAPVLLLGGGVRLAKAEAEALAVAEALGFPVVVSWSGFDLLPHTHPLFAGHIGVYGDRGANIAVQNSDLLISVGSRLDTRQTGGRVATFARGAKKVMVDVDRNEIEKGRGLAIDVGIAADAKTFLSLFAKKLPAGDAPDIAAWRDKVMAWKAKYSAVLPEYATQPALNAYTFLKKLSDRLPAGQVTIVDEGGNLVWTMQSFAVKEGQRLISTFGNSPMGYALPAAIGACFAIGKKPVVCIDGDGGFQLNIQELQTVRHYNLPIKIFILNNRSMGIIKQFQDLYFDSRYIATTPEGGYSSPDFSAVAKAYGIESVVIERLDEAEKQLEEVLSHEGPILCDVRIDTEQKLNPKLEFGRPLEDMAPYLSRDEFMSNMTVPPLPGAEEIPKNVGWQTLDEKK
jgi:acetolactate synthase-1/2/3 large subunit